MAEDLDDIEQEPLPQKTGIGKRVEQFHRNLETLDADGLKRRRAKFGVRFYRFLVLMWSGIMRTELARRAAALTYTTILSIFPLIAVISSSASIFYTSEKEEEFMAWIEHQFLPSMEEEEDTPIPLTEAEVQLVENQEQASQNLRSMFTTISAKFRDNAAGVGVFGFIGLLLTCGILYYSIESVVNMTWQSKKWRWTQSLTSFITVLVFAPIILALSVASSSVAVMFLSKEVKDKVETAAVVAAIKKENIATTTEEAKAVVEKVKAEDGLTTAAVTPQKREVSRTIQKIRSVTKVFAFMLPYISMILNAIILGLAYSFLPKTKVLLRYSFLGGAITAATWALARQLFVYYIAFSSVNRTLADALGVTVIFLIWIYITWIILLLGNLLVYTMQNFESLWAEKRASEQIMLDARLLVAIMVVLARRFVTTGGGHSEMDIRARLGLKQGEFAALINRLVEGRFVTPTTGDGYQVAHPPEQIAVRNVLAAGCDISALPISQKARSATRNSLLWMQARSLEVGGNATIADMLKMAPGDGPVATVPKT